MLAQLLPPRWRPELVGLVALAILTRLTAVTTPVSVVFDEVYFKNFAGHYLDGRYFFDIHPPLGKLLLAGWAKLLGLGAGSLLDTPAVTLRFLPALAGIAIIPLFWAILRRFGVSRPFAFLGAAALLFDNALLVESRFILIDAFLMLFGLGALYAYQRARAANGRAHWLWLALAALSAGAAASTKWTGLTALALVVGFWLYDTWRHRPHLGRVAAHAAIWFVLPVSLYLSAFWLHFQLLPASGDGDAFMSIRFQQTLQGSQYYVAGSHMSYWDKLIDVNREMYNSNKRLTATHPYGSRWYTWPLEQRPVYYWQGAALPDGRQGNIYLLGNPIVWWGIVVAALSGLLVALQRGRRLRPATRLALVVTASAYLMNFLPFVAVTRVMFLYHYFFSFIFSLAVVILVWNDLATDHAGHHPLSTRSQRWWFGGVLAVIVIAFVFFAPLSYGTLLSPAGLQARIWLPSWR